jgi:hypothetical protein
MNQLIFTNPSNHKDLQAISDIRNIIKDFNYSEKINILKYIRETIEIEVENGR